jgi:hypothetical protein
LSILKKPLILQAEFVKPIWGNFALLKLAIMIKKCFNYIAIPLAILAAIFTGLYSGSETDFSDYSTEGLDLHFTVSNDLAMLQHDIEELDASENVLEHYMPYLGKTYVAFKEAVGFKESQGNYFTVNDFGYLGKYQFGAETLQLIGINNPEVFLYSPELQERAFLANLQRNKWILRKDIKKYDGKVINNLKITESGILAAAHLAGPGSVQRFLRSHGRDNVSDAFGSSVAYYIKRFSGYDTSTIAPNKKAKAML